MKRMKKIAFMGGCVTAGLLFSVLVGCTSSGDCNNVYIRPADCSAKYWIDDEGDFSYVKIKLALKGDSDPETFEFSISGSGMQKYYVDESPELTCEDEFSEYEYQFTYADFKDNAGDYLTILPSTLNIFLKYTPGDTKITPYEVSVSLSPHLENPGDCTTPDPEAPKLIVGTFNTSDNFCYCPITIQYTKKARTTYTVYFYETVEEAIAKRLVDDEGIDITKKLTSLGSNQYSFNWEPTKPGLRKFRVGVRAKKGTCTASKEKKSTVQSLETLPCIVPQVSIKKITKGDGTEITSDNVVVPRIDGPFTVDVYAKTDNSEKPNSIKLTVTYDKKGEPEIAALYNNADILRTVTYIPESKADNCIYQITWDGRDEISNRIVPGGSYKINATAQFTKQATDTRIIKVSAPVFTNYTCDYPGTAAADVAWYLSCYDANTFEFNSEVHFLIEDPIREQKFDWIRQFSIIGQTIPVNTYQIDHKTDDVFTETMLGEMALNSGVFSYIGHAGRMPASPYRGYLMFRGNWIYAECGADYAGYCGRTGIPDDICLEVDCSGKYRDDVCTKDATKKKTYLDDMLLAVLVGCRTAAERDIDHQSVARRLQSHGVDCVIGSQRRLLTLIMNLWYYHFYEEAFETKLNIGDAAAQAYSYSLCDITYLFPDWSSILNPGGDDDDFLELQALMGTDVDPETGETFNKIDTYGNSITILDNEGVSNTSILPARFGATHPCPQ